MVTASRREVLGGGLALAAGSAAVVAQAQAGGAAPHWQPSLRYPDPAVHVVDKRFDKYRITVNANIERLYTAIG